MSCSRAARMNKEELPVEIDLPRLKKIRHVVMDMDGTIYQGKRLFPTTLPFLALLRSLGIGYTFLTNNSSRGIPEYLRHLEEFGIEVEPKQMVSSTINTVDWLRRNRPEVKRLFLLGTDSFRKEVASYGFTDVSMEEEPEAVIVAFDTGLTFKRLCKAAWWIKHGKLWICTHPDPECPTEQDTTLVDCGSIAACLRTVSGKEPLVLGKPNREMMDTILAANHVRADEALMCGDRMGTDIQLAVNSDVASVLISPLPHEEVPGNIATWTVPHLGILGEWLSEARAT